MQTIRTVNEPQKLESPRPVLLRAGAFLVFLLFAAYLRSPPPAFHVRCKYDRPAQAAVGCTLMVVDADSKDFMRIMAAPFGFPLIYSIRAGLSTFFCDRLLRVGKKPPVDFLDHAPQGLTLRALTVLLDVLPHVGAGVVQLLARLAAVDGRYGLRVGRVLLAHLDGAVVHGTSTK